MTSINHKLALLVNHNIFLDKQQRFTLAMGDNIECTGITTPVWFNSQTGATSEPAQEIFCRYYIKNIDSRSGQVRGIKNGTGYILYLPQKPDNYHSLPDLDMELVAALSAPERQAIFTSRNEWFDRNPEPPNPTMLLDISDGGAGYLRYEIRATAKMVNEPDTPRIYISHNVEIKSLESLAPSLIM